MWFDSPCLEPADLKSNRFELLPGGRMPLVDAE
jgi:hypothetical protein